MNEIASKIQEINFKNISSVKTGLKRVNIPSASYKNALLAVFSESPVKGRMMVKGLLEVAPNFEDRHQILMACRGKDGSEMRREVVISYKEARYDYELVTGLSLMTTKDAALFFRDYFDVGGKMKNISEWLANISQIYIREKRKGKIKPEYDGFWDDLWDGVVSAGKSIGEAITTVADAVVDAGKKFVEIVNDVIDYTQSRFNDIVEALLDAGKDIGEFLSAAIDKGVEAVTKVFKAIIEAGRKAIDILKWIYDNAVDFVKDGIDVLIKIGVRIKEILKSAVNLGLNTLKEVIGHLVDLGHSVWYILVWAAKNSFEILTFVFEKMIEIGKTLGNLVAWCIRRTFDIMKKGFEVLMAMGNTAYTIIKTLITDPKNILSKSFEALKQLGATAYDFLKAAADLGIDFVKKVYETLEKIGIVLVDILEYAVKEGFDIFKEIAICLLQVGLKIFDILLWAVNKSVLVFTWVLEVADAVMDSFFDIVEWVFSIGGNWLKNLAHWLAEKARFAVDWFKDKVILPIISVGKLVFVVALALTDILFLAIAFFVLKSLVDVSKTDYKNWPSTLEEFKNTFADKLAANLPEVDSTHKYVILSDVHKESKKDIDAGIGHFYQNKTLFKNVLNHYGQDDTWTLVSVGDDEEFWYCNDLSTEENPVNKIIPIVNNNKDVYEILSNSYYKYMATRRFIKIRGNHDDIWTKETAVNKLEGEGFPDLKIYDYALIKRNGKDILIMHGQQFDPYNCDANNFFGKFSSNFVGESLDSINETLIDIFGDGARIEGWSLAPFYTRSEWENEPIFGEPGVEPPRITDDVMFSEKPIVELLRKYDCSVIIGHTHNPKIMKDKQDNTRYYINSGTSGWWENCVWTIEITQDEITLNAWTSDNDQMPYRFFKLSEASTF